MKSRLFAFCSIIILSAIPHYSSEGQPGKEEKSEHLVDARTLILSNIDTISMLNDSLLETKDKLKKNTKPVVSPEKFENTIDRFIGKFKSNKKKKEIELIGKIDYTPNPIKVITEVDSSSSEREIRMDVPEPKKKNWFKRLFGGK